MLKVIKSIAVGAAMGAVLLFLGLLLASFIYWDVDGLGDILLSMPMVRIFAFMAASISVCAYLSD